MPKTPITDPIVRETFRLARGAEAPTEIHVVVGRPYDAGEGEWRCPVMVEGLERQYPDISGEGSLQALCLALSLVRARFEALIEGGAKLFHLDDDRPYQIADLQPIFSRVGS